MKKYFGFDNRRTSQGGISRGFLLLFLLLLVPAIAIWYFYRWLFADDTHLLVPLFIAGVTAWLWAYLIGYGSDHHTYED